ncbi:hypothetical protein BXZ70DRAFT_1008209 [Cristinia sonorae]|uniref:Co-chaperone HscB C-terminal oligomerisation domain-containing protein n=1 Tax=Cristinia sonorae TaxID=1940300 RepID=A0A8K0XQK4_9AGAR|nr:hypothetical protein BXZ70DRAFT_1008209 [Cristinia sonorae]
MSYHEVMGFNYQPNPFQLDHSTLRARFLALQRLVHPDRWAVKSPTSGEIAARVSEAVNTINSHLSNPFLRTAYILQREGVASESESILDDPDVVMEVMEVREALEEAESEEEVERIRLQNQERLKAVEAELSQLVAAKAWDSVATAATRLKYLQGIEQAARAWPHSVHDH